MKYGDNGEDGTGDKRRTASGWIDCPECGAELKTKNLETHVREKHPREYLDHYPEAPQKHGIGPCPECWEWLSLKEETTVRVLKGENSTHRAETMKLTAHIATEHPGAFKEHEPDGCILCALGYRWPFWPPVDEADDDDVLDFIYDGDGEIRWGAAAAYLSNEIDAAITEEQVEEHTEEHANISVSAAPHSDIMTGLAKYIDEPTDIEKDVMDLTEAGDEFTVPELADVVGRSERGVRERVEDMIDAGILKCVRETRPALYRATGESKYDDTLEHWEDDSDPVFVPRDEVFEDFESLHGHPMERTGAY